MVMSTSDVKEDIVLFNKIYLSANMKTMTALITDVTVILTFGKMFTQRLP